MAGGFESITAVLEPLTDKPCAVGDPVRLKSYLKNVPIKALSDLVYVSVHEIDSRWFLRVGWSPHSTNVIATKPPDFAKHQKRVAKTMFRIGLTIPEIINAREIGGETLEELLLPRRLIGMHVGTNNPVLWFLL